LAGLKITSFLAFALGFKNFKNKNRNLCAKRGNFNQLERTVGEWQKFAHFTLVSRKELHPPLKGPAPAFLKKTHKNMAVPLCQQE
jgi:muconolactone delta-isomerase